MIKKYNKLVDNIVSEYLDTISQSMFSDNAINYDIMEYQGILCWPVEFCDMYFNIDDILLAYHNKISWKIFIDFYDYSLECHEKNIELWINLYNYWRKYTLNPELLKKEREDSLVESTKKVEIAFNTFTSTIKNTKI